MQQRFLNKKKIRENVFRNNFLKLQSKTQMYTQYNSIEKQKYKKNKYRQNSNQKPNNQELTVSQTTDMSNIKYVNNRTIGIIIVFIVFFALSGHQIQSFLNQYAYPLQIYNQEFTGQTFGNFSELYLNLSQIYSNWSKNNINQYSSFSQNLFYFRQIQVGSTLDFGLTELIDFENLQKQLQKKLAYQLGQFQFKQSLERQIGFIKKYFQNNQQIENFLDQLKLNSKAQQKTIEFILAIQSLRNPYDPKILEAQYYYANKKYNIGADQEQSRICIYSSQSNIANKKDRIIKYFQQIQNLNYTNFHVVFVDDFSNDGSFESIYQYLKHSKLRIRNRIKMIHNLQKLGVLANMNFWMKKYCEADDIVVVIDADDIIIGRQGLKIINSIYKSPNVWYAYSKYVQTRPDKKDQQKDYQKQYFKGFSSYFFSHKIQQYRASFDWQTSAMRSFRKKLLDSVPLSSFIEYYYQQKLGVIWPRFYKAGADMFIVHSQLQIAGNHRIVYIQDYFYLYYFSANTYNNCYREHQLYEGYKSKLKTPLAIMSNINKKALLNRNYKIQKKNLDKVQQSYIQLLQCKEKIKILTKNDN